MAGGHYETAVEDNEDKDWVSWSWCVLLMRLIPHVRVWDRWRGCAVPRGQI